MPEPRPYSDLPDSVVDLRLCVVCGTDFWGMYPPDGKCFRCRKPGAPRPPWNQSSAAEGEKR